METYQVIAGYSDIKVELKERAGILKPLSDIKLWFTFEDEILCVHDFENHDKYIIVAFCDVDQCSWKILLRSGSYGEKLVLSWTSSIAAAKLARELNVEYSLMGHTPFRR
jgi:hypothetical protein